MSSNIGQFLDKIRQTINGEDSFKEKIIETIKERIGFSVDKKQILYENRKIKIKTDPYLKTEINLQKNQILEKLRQEFPKKNILDII